LQNFQSDIAGVAAHTDRTWSIHGHGRIANGTIWVANNGTGTSTLYRHGRDKDTLVVNIASSRHNRGERTPLELFLTARRFLTSRKMETRSPVDSSSPVKMVRFQVGTRRSTNEFNYRGG
jgi:hypothetical protein